jgi:acetyltransferase
VIRYHRVTQLEPATLQGLNRLLIDVVSGGASVGFLAPLTDERATRYWEGVQARLGQGQFLWVAEQGGQVVGSVQLELCPKENGRHRAEVQKLMVLSSQRGRGLATALLREAEEAARREGRSLLVLDTEAQSPADRLYRHLGWTRIGETPDYAASPDGQLRANAYYFKRLEPSAG